MAPAGPTATAAIAGNAMTDVETSTVETTSISNSSNHDRNNHQQPLAAAAQPPLAQRSPPLSLHHPMSSRTATKTSATTNASLTGNGISNDTADKGTISSGRNSFHRIAALFLLTLLLVFGAGFGLGVLYSKNHLCRCSGNEYSNEKATSEPLENATTTHCNNGNSRDDDTSSSSGSTIPPVDDASSKYLPPIYMNPNAVTCANNADALDELRMAVTSMAHDYINQFANYIRMGGNNSLYADYESIEWHDYVAAITTGTGANATNATDATNHLRSRRAQKDAFTLTSSHLGPNWRRRSRHNGDNLSAELPPRPPRRRFARARPTFSRPRGGMRHRKMQSADSNDNAGSTLETRVLEADVVQTNHGGDLVYVAHGDEIMILQSATTAVQGRLRVPKRHYNSVIGGMLLLKPDAAAPPDEQAGKSATTDEVLVVMVQEYDFVTLDVDSSDVSISNTTVLVYYPHHDNESSDAFKLVQRYSLPGMYDRAFAIVPNEQGGRHQPQHVHVATSSGLALYAQTEYLTPAFLQTNSTAWYSSDAPKLVLNESQYRRLAYAQFGRSVDAIVQDLAAGHFDAVGQIEGQPLDCTGFVALSRLLSKDTNLGLIQPGSLVHITSFDFSSVSTAPLHETMHKGTMSMLPPGDSSTSYWNMLVSDKRLFMACELVSGQTFTVESAPVTWIVAFDLVNATVQPMPLSGLVSGRIFYGLELDYFQTNGKDYLRLITTQTDNLTDYYYMHDEDAPFPSMDTVLQILQVSGNDDNGLMPVVGELTLFRGQGHAVASVYRQDFIMVAVGRMDTFAAWYSTSHTVFTIDTSDPTNPHVVGELFVPVKALGMYSMDENWIVGLSSFGTSDEYPFPQPLQLLWWNASDPTRLAYRWMDDTTLLTNGTGINSTIAQVISNSADDYYVSAAMRYIQESNVLVLPVRTERYKVKPCRPDEWMYDGSESWYQNQSLFNESCQYDQVTVLDGFWIFKIDLASTGSMGGNYSGSGIRNITKHFEINHASQDLLRQDCVGSDATVPTRTLAFNGDVMTMKRNAILSHDLLTKSEAAPAVIFASTDCN